MLGRVPSPAHNHSNPHGLHIAALSSSSSSLNAMSPARSSMSSSSGIVPFADVTREYANVNVSAPTTPGKQQLGIAEKNLGSAKRAVVPRTLFEQLSLPVPTPTPVAQPTAPIAISLPEPIAPEAEEPLHSVESTGSAQRLKVKGAQKHMERLRQHRQGKEKTGETLHKKHFEGIAPPPSPSTEATEGVAATSPSPMAKRKRPSTNSARRQSRRVEHPLPPSPAGAVWKDTLRRSSSQTPSPSKLQPTEAPVARRASCLPPTRLAFEASSSSLPIVSDDAIVSVSAPEPAVESIEAVAETQAQAVAPVESEAPVAAAVEPEAVLVVAVQHEAPAAIAAEPEAPETTAEETSDDTLALVPMKPQPQARAVDDRERSLMSLVRAGSAEWELDLTAGKFSELDDATLSTVRSTAGGPGSRRFDHWGMETIAVGELQHLFKANGIRIHQLAPAAPSAAVAPIMRPCAGLSPPPFVPRVEGSFTAGPWYDRYTQYSIRVAPTVVVHRRYSELLEVYGKASTMFPLLRLPFPPKTAFPLRESVVETRRSELQHFFEILSQILPMQHLMAMLLSSE